MYQTEMILEFHIIKEMLCQHAISDVAKQHLSELKPYLSERECRKKMEETTEARKLLDSSGTPPLAAMKEIDKVLSLCGTGVMLTTEQLEAVSTFISSCNRMKQYLKRAESQRVAIASFGQSICQLDVLQDEIDSSIQNSLVQSSASSKLKDIRRKIDATGSQLKKKLDDLLRGRKNIFADAYIAQRNGRFVVPVKKEYKSQVPGTVIDISGTGGTYFIEPASASKLQDEISILEIEEDNEIRRILYELTILVENSIAEIKLNIEAMTILDIVFAKAKLSSDMKAVPVPVDTSRTIKIKQGRHPLLKKEECVPLDFQVGGNVRGIIITGPNTGGKTVALKTVGLLSMMAQSGLHVPVEDGSFCMNNLVLCDIGDGQSISENLSTFSAHIKNIIKILEAAGEDSLVLLDELGSGTDPAEGMGIAIAILEEICKKKCLLVATTHYPEVKEYAAQRDGYINARMAFDRESLKPLYQLEIGEAGESCALYIAKRLGFPQHLLSRAYQEAYHIKTEKIEKDILYKNDFMAIDKKADTPQSQNTISVPRIKKLEPEKKVTAITKHFNLGDGVIVNPDKSIGIVFQPTDEKGMVGVQIKKNKIFVNYKRLDLNVAASQLYPPDYDFSIIFDSVENRKASHLMDRKYVAGLTIPIEKPGMR